MSDCGWPSRIECDANYVNDSNNDDDDDDDDDDNDDGDDGIAWPETINEQQNFSF